MMFIIRKSALATVIAVSAAVMLGCSSSDDGKSAELQKQLDMANADLMTAEQERDAAKTAQTTAEQERDAAKQAQTDAETAKMTAEQERDAAKDAQTTAEQERDAAKQAQTDAETAKMTAEQTLADAQFNAAVANAVEKVTAWGLRQEFDAEEGTLNGTTAWLNAREADANSGSEFATLSQTHKYGEVINSTLSWRDENGELQFILVSSPTHGSLHDEIGVYTWRLIDTSQTFQEDQDGVMTSSDPVEAHGLGSAWQGFDLMRTDDGAGIFKVRLFADFEDSDVLAMPYDGYNGVDNYERQILLTDDRIPGTPAGRDGLHIGIPGDGLRGSLDGVEGTFSCAGFYCALETYRGSPRYFPWIGSQAIRFTPADTGQPEDVDASLATPATEIPKVDYLTFGSWLFLPEDATDIDAYDFGVFAGGDDPFTATNIQALAGTASYAGKAAGTYAELIQPQTETFTADVMLTADFGSESDFGRMTGEVSNFELESGKSSPLSTLRLQPEEWRGPDAPNIRTAWDDGHPIPGGGLVEGETVADGGWWGTWGGRFFGNGAAATDLPTGFAGTFGATDGTRSVAGSFGTRQQP